MCPAATYEKASGINSGDKGGRACWAIAGTFCKGEIQGTYVQKLSNCMKCDFYQLVRAEEGEDYIASKEILNKIRD